MADRRGINNNNLKQENRGLLLKMIATGEGRTRIELASLSGLSRMSVSNIIGEFIEQGIVAERETEPVEGQGRNPILLSIAETAPKIIGIDIHRSECVAVLSDLNLNVIKMERCPLTDENSKDLFPMIFNLIDKVMVGTPKEKILGIGVGGSGPVDLAKGRILNPPDFHGLHDLPVTEILKEHYQIPVCMDSQYNCGVLAEKYYGKGKGFHDLIFVGIMRGIGSGVIVDDEMLRHGNGFTSEIGHVSVDWNGNLCGCGNRGCLETYAGSEVIREKLNDLTKSNKSFREYCEAAEITALPEVEAVFEDMVEKLACGLISTVNLLNPEAIIIGHEGYFLPKRYLKKLEEIVNQRKISGNYRYVTVLKSAFANQAHIIGCPCTIIEKVFSGRLNFYLGSA
ncbi:putative NBD/HSP70 family sugar kinase [Lachnospiraceae bacterium PF1-21]